MSSWVSAVKCKRCGARDWSVKDGVWTCICDHPMHDARENSADRGSDVDE